MEVEHKDFNSLIDVVRQGKDSSKDYQHLDCRTCCCCFRSGLDR